MSIKSYRIASQIFIVGAVGLAACSLEHIPSSTEPVVEEKAASAFVDKVSGEWASGCQPNAQTQESYVDHFKVNSDHSFQTTTDVFLNSSCSGTAVDHLLVHGHFLVSSLPQEHIGSLDLQYVGPFDEGDITYLRVRLTLQNDQTHVEGRVQAVRVLQAGQEKNLPAQYVGQIPIINYSR